MQNVMSLGKPAPQQTEFKALIIIKIKSFSEKAKQQTFGLKSDYFRYLISKGLRLAPHEQSIFGCDRSSLQCRVGEREQGRFRAAGSGRCRRCSGRRRAVEQSFFLFELDSVIAWSHTSTIAFMLVFIFGFSGKLF